MRKSSQTLIDVIIATTEPGLVGLRLICGGTHGHKQTTQSPISEFKRKNCVDPDGPDSRGSLLL